MFRTMPFSLLAVSLLFLSGCSLFQPDERPLSGTIEAEEVPIVAEAAGLVQSVKVGEGDVVHSGSVLAEIDKRNYEAAVNEAEAAKAQAQAKLDEAKAGSRNPSIQKGIALVQQADATIVLQEARAKQAQAALAQSKDQVAQVEMQWEGAKRTLAFQENRLKEAVALFQRGRLPKRSMKPPRKRSTRPRPRQINWRHSWRQRVPGMIPFSRTLRQPSRKKGRQRHRERELSLIWSF